LYRAEGSTWNNPILFCVTTQITGVDLQTKSTELPNRPVLTTAFVKSILGALLKKEDMKKMVNKLEIKFCLLYLLGR
jgi:hypothetical protein